MPPLSPVVSANGRSSSQKKAVKWWDPFGSVLNTKFNSTEYIPVGVARINSPYIERKAIGEVDASDPNHPFRRRQVYSPTHPSYFVDAVIAVVGESRAGRSTFIKNAGFDHCHFNGMPASSYQKDMFVGGRRKSIVIWELLPSDVSVTQDGSLERASNPGPSKTSRCDGLVLVYDVMNEASLQDIPNMLRSLQTSELPIALVAAKCDHPPSAREINPDEVEQKASKIIPNMMNFQASNLDTQTQEYCLMSTVTKVLRKQLRPVGHRSSFARPRAQTISSRHKTRSAQNRSPADSISVVPRLRPSASFNDIPSLKRSASKPPTPPRPPRPEARQEARQEANEETVPYADTTEDPVLSPHQIALAEPRTSASFSLIERMKGELISQSYQDIEESQTLISYQPLDIPSEPTPSEPAAATLEDLVDRMLAPQTSPADFKFVIVFFQFYRLFVAPIGLLDAIIFDYQQICDYFSMKPPESAFTEQERELESRQQRVLLLIEWWIRNHQGDFAHSFTRNKLASFLSTFYSDSTAYVLAKRIRQLLSCVVDDDDTNWACSDSKLQGYSPDHESATYQTNRSTFLSSSSADLDDILDEYERDAQPQRTRLISGHYEDEEIEFRDFAPDSVAAISANAQRTAQEAALEMSKLVQSAQRQAALLTPHPVRELNLAVTRGFLMLTDREIACELTRLDWALFSTIRPRDFIRDVSLPSSEKPQFPALKSIDRIVAHFNHIAYWVANLVLLEPRPRQRATVLEKFMRVARCLRELNNYNGLGAVIAGIHGSAVHRLAETRALVSSAVQHDFWKLEILVSAPKRHEVYRTAWQHSSHERVPFLPVHRRDLVSAYTGGQNWVDAAEEIGVAVADGAYDRESGLPPQRINWRKFALMGDMLGELQRAQALPYTDLVKNKGVRSLVLDLMIVKDDAELHDRSVFLEPESVQPPPQPQLERSDTTGGMRERLKKLAVK